MATKGRKTVTTDTKNQVGGFSVYRDDKNRQVYLNRLNHIGYVITGHEKLFRTYSSRFFIGIVAAVFTYMFNVPLYLCIVIGIAAFIFMELKFRKFLKALPQIADFKPHNRVGTVQAEANTDIKKILTKILLFIALSILLLVNAYQQQYEGVILYLNYVLSACALVMCIVEVRALLLKRQG